MRVTGIDRWMEFLFREVEHAVEFLAAGTGSALFELAGFDRYNF
jgi:hypothetical protein